MPFDRASDCPRENSSSADVRIPQHRFETRIALRMWDRIRESQLLDPPPHRIVTCIRIVIRPNPQLELRPELENVLIEEPSRHTVAASELLGMLEMEEGN